MTLAEIERRLNRVMATSGSEQEELAFCCLMLLRWVKNNVPKGGEDTSDKGVSGGRAVV